MSVTKKFIIALAVVLNCFEGFCAAPTASAADKLNRTNPRSAVTAFLQTCHGDDYSTAAQYLDLSRIAARDREREGPQLAKDLEAILNSAAHFDVLRLSQEPQGNWRMTRTRMLKE